MAHECHHAKFGAEGVVYRSQRDVAAALTIAKEKDDQREELERLVGHMNKEEREQVVEFATAVLYSPEISLRERENLEALLDILGTTIESPEVIAKRLESGMQSAGVDFTDHKSNDQAFADVQISYFRVHDFPTDAKALPSSKESGEQTHGSVLATQAEHTYKRVGLPAGNSARTTAAFVLSKEIPPLSQHASSERLLDGAPPRLYAYGKQQHGNRSLDIDDKVSLNLSPDVSRNFKQSGVKVGIGKPGGSIRTTVEERKKDLLAPLKKDGLRGREASAVAQSMAVIGTLNPAASSRYKITSGKDGRSVFKCVIYTVDYINVYADTFMSSGNATTNTLIRDEPYLPKKWWVKPGRFKGLSVIDEAFFYKGLTKHHNADDDHFHKFLMDWGAHFGWQKIPIKRTNAVKGYDEYFSRFADKDAYNATAREAQRLADNGELVVAATGATKGGGAGHSFVVVPSQGKFSVDKRHAKGKTNGLDGNGLFQFSKSQAGGDNFGRTTIGGTNPFDGAHYEANFWVYKRQRDKSRGREAVFI